MHLEVDMTTHSGKDLDSFIYNFHCHAQNLVADVSSYQALYRPLDAIESASAARAFGRMIGWLRDAEDHACLLGYDACASHDECPQHNESAIGRVKRICTSLEVGCKPPVDKTKNKTFSGRSLENFCEEVVALCADVSTEIEPRGGIDPIASLPDHPQRVAYSQLCSLVAACQEVAQVLSLGVDAHSEALDQLVDNAQRGA